MADDKYRELGLRPPLADTADADPVAVATFAAELRQRGLPAFAPQCPEIPTDMAQTNSAIPQTLQAERNPSCATAT